MCPPAASPAGRALPSLPPPPPRLSAVVRVVVALPVAARARGQPPPPPRRLCLAAPRASEMAAAAEKGEEERRWWRGAEEMDAAVRREIAIRRLQEEAEEAGTERSRREFAVFETARGDTLFTQSWTPAAADPLRGVVVLLHGLNEHRYLYTSICQDGFP
ncbi:hypothetical protein ACQ4PT_065025 [Festuca glaucescens]